MQVYEGIVQDRMVILPDGVHLEEGLHVEVRIPTAGSESPEDAYKRRLVEAGLLKAIREVTQQVTGPDREPIRVEGRLLSEQIIEERR